MSETRPMQPSPARAFSQPLTKAEAHDLLDAAREGLELSRRAITRALIATGDMSRRLPRCSQCNEGTQR